MPIPVAAALAAASGVQQVAEALSPAALRKIKDSAPTQNNRPTMMTGLVERVLITLPHAQRISASTYLGCRFSFIKGRET